MKKLNMIVCLVIMAFSVTMAQDKQQETKGTNVTKFAAGATVSADDVNFLNLVVTGDASKKRGTVKEVKVGKTTLKEGQKLTADDIAAIEKATKAYRASHADAVTKENKTAPKARGSYCPYYTCWYYDGYYYYYYCC